MSADEMLNIVVGAPNGLGLEGCTCLGAQAPRRCGAVEIARIVSAILSLTVGS